MSPKERKKHKEPHHHTASKSNPKTPTKLSVWIRTKGTQTQSVKMFRVWFLVNRPEHIAWQTKYFLKNTDTKTTIPTFYVLSIILLSYSHSWKWKRKSYYKQWQLVKGPPVPHYITPAKLMFIQQTCYYLLLSPCLDERCRWHIPKQHTQVTALSSIS